MDQNELSLRFYEIAQMMEMMGENPFKINAYHNAARTIENIHDDLAELISQGKIQNIKGIGKAIAEQITEFYETGSSLLYQELKSKFPESLFRLMDIPGLGAKKVGRLYRNLGIKTIDELEKACRENQLTHLAGFGQKTQENIIKGIEKLKQYKGLFLYGEVTTLAKEMLLEIQKISSVIEAELAGSIRRHKEIVKDIDIVASSNEPEKVMEDFLNLPQISGVIAAGTTKTSAILTTGINLDLRVIKPEEYPYALHYFTGSKEHNTAMRHRAKQHGYKLNEYGLFDEKGINCRCRSEQELFAALGLHYIPPELRENLGEFDYAENNPIPVLVDRQDIKGIFHIHTSYSDGKVSLEEMVQEGIKKGCSYLGISDHSRTAYYANGLNIEMVEKQLQEIDAIKIKYPEIVIFKGIESDILKDGSLDYPEEILSRFDFVIASIHSGFQMTEEEATDRLVGAMENPYTTMIGHPTGRILLGREGYPVNIKKLIDKAKEYGVIIELNASPYRLDLDWTWCRYAKEQGVLISVNPDAHHLEELDDIDSGIGIARKGWLEAKDVFNTLSSKEVKEYLMRRKK